MRPALSTVFAGQAGRPGPDAILDACARAEAPAIVLDGSLAPALFEPLVTELQRRGDELPILAIEAGAGTALRPDAPAPRLCATDRDEAQAALAAATATMRRAGELRAPFVVVRLGEVEPVAAQWIDARDHFLRGALDDDALQSLLSSRDRAAERALDVATRALERLAREAERAGVVLLVRNGRRYVDLPSPRELDRLRAELSGAPLCPRRDCRRRTSSTSWASRRWR